MSSLSLNRSSCAISSTEKKNLEYSEIHVKSLEILVYTKVVVKNTICNENGTACKTDVFSLMLSGFKPSL